MIVRGDPIRLPTIEATEDEATCRLREIPAEWLTSLAEPNSRRIPVPIFMENVIIKGAFHLNYANFECGLSIRGSKFADCVDLANCTFGKEVTFFQTTCSGYFTLRSAIIAADVDLSGLECTNLELAGLRVGGALTANGILSQTMICDGLRVERDANFGPLNQRLVRISGALSFVGVTIGGQCLFLGAEFMGESTFDFSKFNGGLFFTNPNAIEPGVGSTAAMFKGNATFISVYIYAHAIFQRSSFLAVCGFDNSEFACDARFDEVVFGDPSCVAPRSARVNTNISFSGAVFKGQSIFQGSHFHQDCAFRETHFRSECMFHASVFKGGAYFDGARFDGPVYFCDRENTRPATFSGDVVFRNATAAADVFFIGVVFAHSLSLQEAHFNVVHFRTYVTKDVPPNSNPQFTSCANSKLDFRGFSYERIYIAWAEAERLIEPFDKQVYMRLEGALRSMGNERDADTVYLSQRFRTREYYHANRQYGMWFADYLYWLIARYGVRPWRLALFALLIVICGTLLFQRAGAVRLKEDKGSTSEARLISLNAWQSAAFTFNQFFPIEVPLGSRWKATDGLVCPGLSYDFIATVLHLAGWLLVPLGVAALTGSLRRRAGP